MRVALLDPPSYTPQYDDRLAAALAARGLDVHLLTAPFLHGEVPAARGYARDEVFFRRSARLLAARPRSRLRYPAKAVDYVPSVRALERRLAELRPDVVHVQWLARPRFDLRWVRRVAAPTVYTAHNATLRQGPEKHEQWREILTAFDRVVVHSHRGLERLAGLGVERARLARIPHPAFDAPAGEPTPPASERLIFFGLLRAHKGLDLLVDALPAIAEAAPGVRLVVAGDDTASLVPGLRARAAELGVGERIDWRLGYLPQAEVDELMESAAVAVLPYREADASGVLATALGHGRPAVVADVGTLGETVEEFAAGTVVPPDDTAALARACGVLLADRDALAAAARGAVAARAALTWEASAEAHERLYRELAA